MTTPCPRLSTLALRLLVVLPVLAGVLVMHGMTSNHDMAMATMVGVGEHTAGAPTRSAHTAGHTDAGTSWPHEAAAANTSSTALDVAPRGHTLGPVCLGVLTATVLALLLARIRALPRQGGRAWAPWTRLPSLSSPPRGALRAPSLTRLCISRT